MRLLNKFYSFIKSVYLNNSKYSNNLRHTLRIFFEREVKTKHTPTMFGATFKGSKWVDYQTFNINKLMIKSGLSYFYYILMVVLVLFMLLGRSKSEQYFGFLPFFSYINFILGYVPLVLSDLTSQVIIFSYVFYNSLYRLLVNMFSRFTVNTLNAIENNYSPRVGSQNPPKVTSYTPSTMFKNPSKPVSNSESTTLFSKSLSTVRTNLLYTSEPKLTTTYSKYPHTLGYGLEFSTLHLKKLFNKTNIPVHGVSLTESESFYTNTLSDENWKVRNINVSLSDITRLYKTENAPTTFNFNLSQNLNTAKQQRWLSRNSLLNEAFISNSFLFTQAKKLIGIGTLDREFSSKNLWIPTKFSNLSENESKNYLNTLSNQLFKTSKDKSFLQFNNLSQSNLQSLNFFENSRLWLFKKYFFTNNQTQNTVVEYPKSFYNVITKNNSHNLNYSNKLYLNTLGNLLNSDLAPSISNTLSTSGTNLISDNFNLNTPVRVGTPQLDVFSGNSLNFFLLITSNTQQSSTTTYFNNLNQLATTGNSKLTNPSKITFTLK